MGSGRTGCRGARQRHDHQHPRSLAFGLGTSERDASRRRMLSLAVFGRGVPPCPGEIFQL